MGRRVWWYLTATDWMLSRYAGPQEGVYTIDPRHLAVNHPLNVNDEDLVDGNSVTDLPLSHATSMSYSLQPICLAELSREFTDRVPLRLSTPDSLAYTQVMEIDSKLEEFTCEIPAFSGLEVASLEQIAEIDARRAPGIIVQRYVLNSMVYAHRAKQHMHYMARGAIDPAYSRSRDICLNSASVIIGTERLLEKENIPHVLIRLRFSGVLYTIAMAAITLLVDLCFSKKEGDSKADFMDACSILDAAREHSPLSEKLLPSLRRFLAKHQVKLPPVGEREDFQTDPRIQTLDSQDKPDEQKEAIFGLGNFDDIYRQFDGGVDINMLDWNNFFSELDSQFV